MNAPGLQIVPFNPALPEPRSDALYLRHLAALLEAYLDEREGESCESADSPAPALVGSQTQQVWQHAPAGG